MKKTLLTLTCATLASAALAADTEVTTSKSITLSDAGPSSTTTTKTTTSTGTVHEYTPGSTFIVKESSGPTKYRYGKKVTYVTKSGKTLADDEVRTRIKVGSPVSVHYGMEGEERVINRVEIDD
jgi:ligand-binding SRPBCC domain-containing protein